MFLQVGVKVCKHAAPLLQAPIVVYVNVLAGKSARQKAMQSTAEISVGEESDEQTESDAEDMPSTDLLPELRMKSAAKKAKARNEAQTERKPPLEPQSLGQASVNIVGVYISYFFY